MRATRKGFTLIELIIVVVVIGVLAGITIAKFVTAREKTYVAAMKADLRNFVLYEVIYEDDNAGAYFSGDGTAQGFKPTPDVTVNATATAGPPPSWQATAVHAKTSITCSIGVIDPTRLVISCP
jgi:prepilin-type N-terminal cleavage/methylation domain-containing protein